MVTRRRKKREKICILTGGGDAPGLNAVIRAAVYTAVGSYGWEVYGSADGYDGLLSRKPLMPLTRDSVRGIINRGGTILGTTNRGNPFKYVVKRGGKDVEVDRSKRLIKRIEKEELDALISIGGEGSLTIARDLAHLGVPIVGVPKTIDNDLSATDITFGFDTAVNIATEAIDRLHTTAESHRRVMLLEVMGRHAGWIALRAGIAGGADVVLIPEIPYDIERVVRKCVRRRDRTRFAIVVVAEGAVPKGGTYSVIAKTKGGMERLGGAADLVARGIQERSDAETRVTVLGHLQRGGPPTSFDRLLATRYGVAAVELVAMGGLGRMVALKTPDISSVTLEEAVAELNTIDPQGQMVRQARHVGIELGAP